MSRKILEVKDLKTRFHTEQGVVHAVNGISYVVDEGESVGIVGESGCGKSVSVLSIMRLLQEPPAKVQGSVIFNGENLLDLEQSEIRKVRGSQIAMIFQDPMTSLNPVLTIGLQLMEPLEIHLGMSEDEARERAAELLQLVGIPQAADRLDDYPHQFSGGMRQRAMIAMALTCNPTLLIADEPTTALDVTIQAQIADLINRLREQFGMSLIWITHDLGVVAGLADRVIVMYAGYIVEEAAVYELYDNPVHPYTFLLLKSLPRMDEEPGTELESIKGLPPDLIDLPPACPFAARCPYVKDFCRQYNPPLYEIKPGHKAACWVDRETNELREDMVAEYMAQIGKAA
ncbi:MAG: ABC transporter ATP-binding protein [Anaerolineales bacterium]